MYVDKTNSGGKCEQFWEVGMVDHLFPTDRLCTHLSSILVPKVVMDSLNQLLSKENECWVIEIISRAILVTKVTWIYVLTQKHY